MSAAAPLFTTPFLVMCGFNFVIFLSAFQLFPVAPFRLLDLGGTTLTAGLFLGFLTYASAFSAPFTGALADRFGHRRQALVCSLAITALSGAYAVASRPAAVLALAVVHGVFWSGLLSANAAYTTELIPPERRAEGIGYYGLSSVLSVAVAPTIGLWLYRGGWLAVCASVGLLNLVMAIIAWRLRVDVVHAPRATGRGRPAIEWHVTAAAVTLFLTAFGYGGVTSFVALMADRAGLYPRAWYFTVLSLTIVASRPVAGRLADQGGPARVLLPSIVLASMGYALLAFPPSLLLFSLSAVLVGSGFGSMYPVFAAWVLHRVGVAARGAAFGGILAALDTGIGSGSIGIGWMASRFGFRPAFAVAAVLAILAAPYFATVGQHMLARRAP